VRALAIFTLALLLCAGVVEAPRAHAQLVDDPEDERDETSATKPRSRKKLESEFHPPGSAPTPLGTAESEVQTQTRERSDNGAARARRLTTSSPSGSSASEKVGPRASFSGAFFTQLAVDTKLNDGREHAAEWRNELFLKAAIEPSPKLRAVLSGRFRHFTAVERNEGDSPYLLFNGERPRHFYEADLWEAYVDVSLPGKVDLRIGNQLFHWGAADFGSPTDVLNPPDLRFPFLSDADSMKLPVFAFSATWRGPSVNATAAYIPFVVPGRAFLVGHDFGLLQPRAYFNAPDVRPLLGDPLSDALQRASFEGAVPSRSLANGQAGVRLFGQAGRVDWGVSYFAGYEPFATPTLDPALGRALAGALGANPDLPRAAAIAASLGQRVLAGESVVTSEFQRRQVMGFDLTAPAGPFLLRLDAGYMPLQTTFVTRRGDDGADVIAAVRRPAITYSAGVEWRKDEDLFVQVQWVHQVTVTRPEDQLFVVKPNVLALLVLARATFLDGDLDITLSLLAGVSQRDAVFGGRVLYKLGKRWSLSAGAMFFQGEKTGPGGLFDVNDYVFVRLGLSF